MRSRVRASYNLSIPERIMLKYGPLDQLTVNFAVAHSYAMSREYLHMRKRNCTSFFKHICSLPLVHGKKGVLLVTIIKF